MGGLIGTATASKDGLASTSIYKCSPKHKVSEANRYKIIARVKKVVRGCLFVSCGQQDSAYNFASAFVSIAASGGSPMIAISYIFKQLEMEFFYRFSGDIIEFAVKDIGEWNHVQSASFHPDILAVVEDLTSINDFTAI